jgi:hypothetical protein
LPQTKVYGEMAERFKAAVLTRRQDAEADSGVAAGPEGVEGRMPGTKLP